MPKFKHRNKELFYWDRGKKRLVAKNCDDKADLEWQGVGGAAAKAVAKMVCCYGQII